MQFLRVRIQNAASDRSIPPKLPIFYRPAEVALRPKHPKCKNEFVFRFSYFTFENEKRIRFSYFTFENEKGIRFSFANLKTKNEKGIRYPFFVRKFENEKTVYTRTQHSLCSKQDVYDDTDESTQYVLCSHPHPFPYHDKLGELRPLQSAVMS